MSAARALADLVSALAATYPAKLSDRANRLGVTAVVEPERGEYIDTSCSPSPMDLTATVTLLAAMTGERGVADLLTHLDAVADLVREAGWSPQQWEPGSVEDSPAIVITAVTQTEG